MLKWIEKAWETWCKWCYILLTPFFACFMLIVWIKDVVDALNGDGSF